MKFHILFSYHISGIVGVISYTVPVSIGEVAVTGNVILNGPQINVSQLTLVGDSVLTLSESTSTTIGILRQ